MGAPASLRALIAAVLLPGCQPEPLSLDQCADLNEPTAREECRYRFILPLVGDSEALDAALATVEDPASRDLLLLRLAIAEPTRAAGLCQRVTGPGATERCRQVLGRPHLQTSRKPPQPPPGGGDTPP